MSDPREPHESAERDGESTDARAMPQERPEAEVEADGESRDAAAVADPGRPLPPYPGAPTPPSYGPPPGYGPPPSYGPVVPTMASSMPSYGTPSDSTGASDPAGAGYARYASPASPQPGGGGGYAPGNPLGRRKGLAITSVVLGGVALVLCLLPFINYVALVAAAVGTVLGIIALSKKQPKGLALTGTILSGVAFLAALLMVIVYGLIFAHVPSSSESSSSDDSPSQTEHPPIEGAPEVTPGPSTLLPGAKECATGTSIALGDTGFLTLDGKPEWEISVVSADLDATDKVMDTNSLNARPPAGYEYALFLVTVTFLGEEEAHATAALDFSVAGGDTDAGRGANSMVLPDPVLLFAPTQSTGDTVTGNVAVFVPSDGADKATLQVESWSNENVCDFAVR